VSSIISIVAVPAAAVLALTASLVAEISDLVLQVADDLERLEAACR
jgi:hypothetical protein